MISNRTAYAQPTQVEQSKVEQVEHSACSTTSLPRRGRWLSGAPGGAGFQVERRLYNTTPAALLHAQADALERQAAELRRIAAELDSAPGVGPVAAPDEWLGTGEAAQVAGVSKSQVRRWAARYGTGEKTLSGSLRHNRRALLAISRCESELERNALAHARNDAPDGIHKPADAAHLCHDEEETK